MTTLWSCDHEIQEIARKVPDPFSRPEEVGHTSSHRCEIPKECAIISPERSRKSTLGT